MTTPSDLEPGLGRYPRRWRLRTTLAAFLLLLAACGGSSSSDSTNTQDGATTQAPNASTTSAPASTLATTTTPAPTSTTAAPTTVAPTTAAPTTTAAAAPLQVVDDVVTVDWNALTATPFYATPDGGSDPFFHIHTTPDVDGFFLSFELYTTGYGQEWTGETGTFDISCDNPTSSTGICPYFDPDGPGPEPVKGSDFQTTGSLTINQLDEDGYEIVVHTLTFTDGTTFAEFTITG